MHVFERTETELSEIKALSFDGFALRCLTEDLARLIRVAAPVIKPTIANSIRIHEISVRVRTRRHPDHRSCVASRDIRHCSSPLFLLVRLGNERT